jgi:hypothetical protein
MLVGRADLQIVDEESFNAHRSEFREKPITPPANATAASAPAQTPPQANPVVQPK